MKDLVTASGSLSHREMTDEDLRYLTKGLIVSVRQKRVETDEVMKQHMESARVHARRTHDAIRRSLAKRRDDLSMSP